MNNKKKYRFLCRICLDHCGKKSISLSENFKDSTIADHISSIANVQIKENDRLPRKICSSCLLELGSAVDFKEKCLRSRDILENHHQMKMADITIPELLKDVALKQEIEYAETDVTLNDAECFDGLGLYQSEDIDSQVIPESAANKNKSIEVICDDCGNLFKSKCKLRVHWKKVHLQQALICQDCKREFRSYKAFHKHRKDKTLACTVAGSSQVLIEGAGKSRIFHCRECDYKSFRIKDIHSHLVTHTGDKPYQCDTCPSAYTQLCALQAHKEMSHNEYKVQITCHFCGKYIQGRRRVYRHLKMHTEIRVQCDVCKKTFKNKKSLHSHMKRHSGVKNYTCEKCAVSFYTTAELCNHRRMVHNKGKHWFQCNQCEFKSVRAKATQKHQLQHSEGKIPCTVCGRFLESYAKLVLHQRRHFEEKKYPCPHCGIKFFRKDSIRTHIRKKHKEKYICHSETTAVEVKKEISVMQPVGIKKENIILFEKSTVGQDVIEIKFSPNIN